MVQLIRLMETIDSQVKPVPPSLMKALMAGFDAVSNHIGLILFSISLDLLLWMGPHFFLSELIQSVFNQAAALPELNTPDMTNMIQASRDMWSLFGERFNLLSALRAYPVGIPSLMAGRSPTSFPGGVPIRLEVSSFSATIGLWLLLTLVGLTAGTFYFIVIKQAALTKKLDFRQALIDWPWSLLQVIFLSIFFIALLVGLTIPFSCVLSLLVLTGFSLGQFAVLIFGGILAWLLFPLIFSPHGIFVNHRKMWASVRDSVRLTRMTLPSTGLFILVILLLSEGLDLLWNSPSDVSWFALVGVIGHAFITSGLLAASFVYYRDADRFVQSLLHQAKLASIQDQMGKA
jgi:hypothetical protein